MGMSDGTKFGLLALGGLVAYSLLGGKVENPFDSGVFTGSGNFRGQDDADTVGEFSDDTQGIPQGVAAPLPMTLLGQPLSVEDFFNRGNIEASYTPQPFGVTLVRTLRDADRESAGAVFAGVGGSGGDTYRATTLDRRNSLIRAINDSNRSGARLSPGNLISLNDQIGVESAYRYVSGNASSGRNNYNRNYSDPALDSFYSEPSVRRSSDNERVRESIARPSRTEPKPKQDRPYSGPSPDEDF